MTAPYNWWSTNNASSIDALIEDMLDNNGGGWVNYSPFYTSAAMNQLDWNGTSPSNIPLGRELSGTLFFPKTMTLNNSPYYLVGPWTIAPGVRLTIDPGVQVFANTTNSSMLVHGELHSLGTAANPVFFGVNPSMSWTQNSGYWGGIQGQTPSQGTDSLLMRNTTVSGPTCYWYSPGQSSTGYSNLFNFQHFFRINGDVIVDNVTMKDGREVRIRPETSNFNDYSITNLTLENISYIQAEGTNFGWSSRTGSWRDEVTIIRSSIYMENTVYFSTTNSYGHNYTSLFNGWDFIESDVILHSSSTSWTPSTTNPAWISGSFTDTHIRLYSSSGWSGPLLLRGSTFDATGSPSATAWPYSQYASQRGTAFITADSSSYGKWTVENSSFAPTNGWTGIDYTYQNNRMSAPYNWWGSSNRTVIDGLIEDINDNNGGNWVNYCPMYDTPTMSTLSTDCTRIRVDFSNPLNGSSQVGYNLTVNYSHLMVSVGDWRLDGNWHSLFSTSASQVTLTGLSMGWHNLCATVSGVGNQQATFCLSFQMTPYFPIAEITSPANGTVLPTTQNSQIIQYNVSNVTSGIWRLNGLNIGAVNINATSVQVTGLVYGNNSICLIGYGLSNLVDTDCISIWRTFPPVSVVISDPLDGESVYSQTLIVVYATSNVTSAKWYLDGYDFGQVILNQTSRTFPALSWGNHTVCISPVGLDGVHPDVCASVTMVAPPLEVTIISPANGTSVLADQVTINYVITNATGGNWTLNGNSVMGVTLWSQQVVILDLAAGSNEICIDAFGLDSQNLLRCVTIFGQTLDSDADGVPDHSDYCPDTPHGTLVTSDGCTDPASDLDGDGVPDLTDLCPDTPLGAVPNPTGCGPSQRDTDGDGINDADDACNGTAPGATIDETGCADSQVDSDGDGVSDDSDAFPVDPTQSTDRDGDGYGDDPSGNSPDHFPDDSTQWADFDRDGWGDNPLGNDPDNCPTIAGVFDGEFGVGCPTASGGNGTGNQDNQTENGTEEPTDCPICGLNIIMPSLTDVNVTVEFEAEDQYMLGASAYEHHNYSWDFGDGSNANGAKVSHNYSVVPNGSRYQVTLCVEFEDGPTECLSKFIVITEDYTPPAGTDNQNGDGSDQASSSGGGSFLVGGFAAFAAFILGLLLATLAVLKINSGNDEEDEAAVGELSALLAEELDGFQEEEELPESSPTPTGMAEAEGLGDNTDDDGYEWNENPPGSGEWYYRTTGSDEWYLWEQ